jgi:hypothetical protein
MPLQRSARGQRARRAAQIAAQGAEHRAVGQRRRRARRATQRQRIARCRHLLGQAGLADARLARQQDDRALAGAGPREQLVELSLLSLASDQRRPHGARLRGRGPPAKGRGADTACRAAKYGSDADGARGRRP